MKDTWTRLIEHALLAGGIAEGCTVLRRVGPRFFPGDGGSLPLDSICLHLEKAAEVLLLSGNMNNTTLVNEIIDHNVITFFVESRNQALEKYLVYYLYYSLSSFFTFPLHLFFLFWILDMRSGYFCGFVGSQFFVNLGASGIW